MLLWASEKRGIEKMVRDAKLTRGVVRRFVAGDSLEDAVEAIKDLNARGIGGILAEEVEEDRKSVV